VSVFDGVEHVRNAEFPGREDQSIGGLLPGELVDVGFQLLACAAEVDGLADEGAGDPHIGIVGADLVGFPARKARDADGVRESEALVDFRVEPQFCALPKLQPGIKGGVPGLATRVPV